MDLVFLDCFEWEKLIAEFLKTDLDSRERVLESRKSHLIAKEETPKVLITTAADDSLEYFFIVFRKNKT